MAVTQAVVLLILAREQVIGSTIVWLSFGKTGRGAAAHLSGAGTVFLNCQLLLFCRAARGSDVKIDMSS